MRLVDLSALCLPILLAAPSAAGAQQEATSMADRLLDDLRVEALRPYGVPIATEVHSDKGVQFGKSIRFRLDGHPDFWRIGVTTPVLKPVKGGDRIVIAFWARARGSSDSAPGRIGSVQLEAMPVVRAIFEKPFDVGPEWKMYQLAGTADRDYAPRQFNAAMRLEAAKQTLDLGPLFVLDYGQPTP